VSTLEPPHRNGAVTTSGVTKRRATRRKITGILFAVFIVAWIIALVYSVTAGGTSPERLDDAAAKTVEANCRAAQRALSHLPQLRDTATPGDRATRLDRENAILAAMVKQQRAVRPTHHTPTVAITGWLDDWQRMINARIHFAQDLRTKGTEARFTEPAYKGVDPIADKMNDWILEQGTRTDACNTNALQAEVVNGPRTYGSTT
jgi:hypothetical protein